MGLLDSTTSRVRLSPSIDGSTTSGSFMQFCHRCSGIVERDVKTMEEEKYTKKLLFTGMEAVAAGAYCYLFQFIIHNKFCATIFRCGCTWNWDGGWVDCNFHNTDGAPKCPWCCARASVAWTTTFLPFMLMFAAYITSLYYRKRCDFALARFIAATFTYFLSASVVGFIFFVYDPEYRHFFIEDFRLYLPF